MKTIAALLISLALPLAGCGGGASKPVSGPPRDVADTELTGLLVSTADLNAMMGTRSLASDGLVTDMDDNRNLLSNLNCLGVWQVGEAAIYGPRGGDGWRAMRLQKLRTPAVDDWDTLAVQSVVAYPSADAARAFFSQSADRWAKCTNHKVNMTVNNAPLPKWLSGNLDRGETRLAMPITRGTVPDVKSCQHILDVVANVIVDVQACRSQASPITKAADIAATIESAMPR